MGIKEALYKHSEKQRSIINDNFKTKLVLDAMTQWKGSGEQETARNEESLVCQMNPHSCEVLIHIIRTFEINEFVINNHKILTF